MKPIDAYNDTIGRARTFLEYHDGLMNIRSRRIRKDWKESFLRLMRWNLTTDIERVDSSDAVVILRPTATLTPNHFSADILEDHLRAALIFGVSALDRYVHERVVKGIVPALRQSSLTKQQEELSLPVTTALQIAQETVAARRNGQANRPANIVRKKVQELLHKRPFQSYRDIEYAFNLLGIKNLTGQLQAAYGAPDLKAVKSELNHIAMRRNQIVHEGDILRHARGGTVKWHPITRKYVSDSLDFLDSFVGHLEGVA